MVQEVSESKWKRKARSLSRLADDQRGKPEGDVARAKLDEIISKHPEAKTFEPVKVLFERDVTLSDIAMMRRNGVSTDGVWTASNIDEAIAKMTADYADRIKRSRAPRLSENSVS